MGFTNLNFWHRIKLVSILSLFFVHGYSTPLDTIKRQNCPNGFLVQVNGEYRCIDTTIRYYPLYPDDEIDSYWNMLKSVNLQILGELKWYGEKIEENRLRIFRIEFSPSFDTIELYSFLEQNQDYIKLIKKKMFLYHFPDPDNISNNIGFVFNVTEKMYSVNYTQTEFLISKKKLKGLIKQLSVLKKCETFEQYGWPPEFLIEYSFKGSYYLLIAGSPEYYWCQRAPKCKCPRKSGFKILKWLSEY